ncbi:hypothetical protein MTP99_013615 [Tenebrio molitor]|nr:hypothetical protein MTP99_013615 [Tenebrio molitor]
MQRSYATIKKSGKLYLFLLLSIIPGFCFSSITLHVIKIGARDSTRCKIRSFENTSWSFEEIQKITQFVGVHQECFIYNYDYNKIANITFKEAKSVVGKEHANSTRVMCTEFVTGNNTNNFPPTYPQEISSYCQSLNYDALYDLAALIPYIVSCLFLVPFADVYGRKRILSIGCYLAYIAVFAKIILLDFTREAIGEAVLYFAYPALKYTTEALILEITGDSLRPFAFVLTYTGLFIPPALAPIFPSVYWKYTQLIAYSTVLLLPPLAWYVPEPPLWFVSKNRKKAAQIAARTLTHSPDHNDTLLLFRNKKTSSQDIKDHLKKLNSLHLIEITSIFGVSLCVGFLSFYPYSKHKLMLYNFDNCWITFLSCISGAFAIILSLGCVYLMNAVKFLLALLLCVNGVLFAFLSKFDSENLNQTSTVIFLICAIEVTTNVTKVVFEFYLQEIFPTSHRCICTAVCGAIMNSALIGLIEIRVLNIFGSEILTSVSSFVGCIIALLAIKKLDRISSLVVNFKNVDSTQE